MNMQDLIHDFLCLVIIKNVDFRPFKFCQIELKSFKFITIRQKIDKDSIKYVQKT